MSASKILDPSVPTNYHESVHETLARLNATEHDDVLAMLPDVRISQLGDMEYAVYDETSEGSPIEEVEEALIVFSAFAQALDQSRPNGTSNLLHGLFLRKVLEEEGITDFRGETMPVILFANAHKGHSLMLAPFMRKQIRNGRLTPIATRALRSMPNLQKSSFIGLSQGGNVALEASRLANSGGEINVPAVGAADPVSEPRALFKLIRQEMASNPGSDYKEGGFESLLKVHNLDENAAEAERQAGFWSRVIDGVADKFIAPNPLLAIGMSNIQFETSVMKAAAVGSLNSTAMTLARGTDSPIATKEIDRIVEVIREQPRGGHVQEALLIKDRGHGWPQNPKLFAEFTLRVLGSIHQ